MKKYGIPFVIIISLIIIIGLAYWLLNRKTEKRFIREETKRETIIEKVNIDSLVSAKIQAKLDSQAWIFKSKISTINNTLQQVREQNRLVVVRYRNVPTIVTCDSLVGGLNEEISLLVERDIRKDSLLNNQDQKIAEHINFQAKQDSAINKLSEGWKAVNERYKKKAEIKPFALVASVIVTDEPENIINGNFRPKVRGGIGIAWKIWSFKL